MTCHKDKEKSRGNVYTTNVKNEVHSLCIHQHLAESRLGIVILFVFDNGTIGFVLSNGYVIIPI